MGVHRERVDPLTDEEDLGLVHRRWILPDDLARKVTLGQVSRLWRGLFELSVLNGNDQVMFERLPLPLRGAAVEAERRDLPASASAGLLLAGAQSVTLVTQVVRLDQGHRDPYLAQGGLAGTLDESDWRDYTLYAVEDEATYLLPIGVQAILCGACGAESPIELPWFGEAQLLAPAAHDCRSCKAALDLARDKALLQSEDVFLLAEVCCKAALSVELPEAPQSEELPDAAVASLLREAFGDLDELADEGTEPA